LLREEHVDGRADAFRCCESARFLSDVLPTDRCHWSEDRVRTSDGHCADSGIELYKGQHVKPLSLCLLSSVFPLFLLHCLSLRSLLSLPSLRVTSLSFSLSITFSPHSTPSPSLIPHRFSPTGLHYTPRHARNCNPIDNWTTLHSASRTTLQTESTTLHAVVSTLGSLSRFAPETTCGKTEQ